MLRMPMSMNSRILYFIPTMPPHERHEAHKRKSVMDKEGLSEDSTDIRSKSMIQKYEKRPQDLDSVNLGQFLVWYIPIQTRSTHRNSENIIIHDADYMDLDEDVEQDALQDETNTGDGAPPSEVK